jgi:competence protein ComEC
MRVRMLALTACLLSVALAQAPGDERGSPVSITFIDVEGGQATLVVSPGGESMLVDAGYPGFNGRDADRIAAEARRAGLTRIDFLIVTHYHLDHVGGVPALAARIPIRTFVDHGPSVESGDRAEALFESYLEVRQRGRHLPVKPDDRVPISGLDARVVASGGGVIRQPLVPEAPDNPLCRDFIPKADDPGENARSVGMVIGYGRFRLLNLGDLTWNTEHGLACPRNLIGPVDVYLTTHHGLASSGPAALVHAVRPRVAVMNNGATKGGSPDAWRIVRSSPGLEDFWQLHYASEAGPDHNVPEVFIANMDESTAHAIRIAAYQDGSFVVTNTRNGQTKRYAHAK